MRHKNGNSVIGLQRWGGGDAVWLFWCSYIHMDINN